MSSFCEINKNLVPMKMVLFCFNGGVGALWTLLTVHMKALGLTLEETAMINTFLPIFSAIASPIYSGFADKFAAYRAAYVLACAVTSTFFHCLMFVPPVYTATTFPVTQFVCDNQTALILTPACFRDNVTGSCGQLTNFLEDVPLSATIENCRYVCNGAPVDSWTEAPFCYDGAEEIRTCVTLNLTQGGTHLDLNFETSEGSEYATGDCGHNISNVGGGDKSLLANAQCLGVVEEGCAVECTVATDAVMSCNLETGSSTVTFWVYFFIRVVAEVGLASCVPLIDTINIAMSKQYGGHFGRQHMFGALGMCIVAPLSGYLVDIFSVPGEGANYVVCFYLADILFIGTSLTTIFFIRFDTPQKEKSSMIVEIRKLCTSVPIISLLICVLYLGAFFGFLETFLYWYLADMGATRFLLGLTLTAGLLPALPFLYYSNIVIGLIGAPNVLSFAFFVYMIRLVGYSLITDPWWCLPYELIEVFTWMLPRVAFSVYGAALAPPALVATTQALVVLIHMNGGRGLGSFLGGHAMELLGARWAFRAAAGAAGVGGVLYTLVHRLVVAPIVDAQAKEQQTEEPHTSNGAVTESGDDKGKEGP